MRPVIETCPVNSERGAGSRERCRPTIGQSKELEKALVLGIDTGMRFGGPKNPSSVRNPTYNFT